MAPWFRLCFFLFFRQEQKELLLAVTFHNIDSLMMVRYLCTYFILGLLFFGILSKIGALLVRKMFWEFRRHRIFGHVNERLDFHFRFQNFQICGDSRVSYYVHTNF